MAHATPFTLYARYADNASLERFLFFLEEETRPAFADEAEDGESQWVEHFEFLAYPWRLMRLDSVTVVADFGNPHEEDDLSDDILPVMEGASGLGAEQVHVLWFYEEECTLECYVNGHREILWLLDEVSEEVEIHQLLSDELQGQLRKIIEEDGDALAVLTLVAEKIES